MTGVAATIGSASRGRADCRDPASLACRRVPAIVNIASTQRRLLADFFEHL